MAFAGCGAVVHCMEIIIPCGSLIFLFLLVIYFISIFSSTSVETGFTLEWGFWCVVFKQYVTSQNVHLHLWDLFFCRRPSFPQRVKGLLFLRSFRSDSAEMLICYSTLLEQTHWVIMNNAHRITQLVIESICQVISHLPSPY